MHCVLFAICQDQARLTIMLVGIVFLFLVGELPTHFASRRSAASLLYDGDISKVHETFMEKWVIFRIRNINIIRIQKCSHSFPFLREKLRGNSIKKSML